MRRVHARIAIVAVGALALLGCGENIQKGSSDPHSEWGGMERSYQVRAQYGTIHGGDGVSFGTGPEEEEGGSGSGIGVNSFLWRAALDTIDFMPLASADPFGGVIITDWYSPPETPEERFKMTVFIRDRALRSDGVKVSVFKQSVQDGNWIDSPVDADTGTKLEDTILTRARQIRVANIETGG